MSKAQLTLYLDSDLKALAKAKFPRGLSKEFEEWIRIRLEQPIDIKDGMPIQDYALEIAKHQSEIQKLRTEAENKKEFEATQTEENMVVDNMIDNMIEYKEDLNNIIEQRIHGLQFLIQRKFHKSLNPLQTKELLEKRIKERGLV
jgi:hypothetical protein